MEDVNKSLSKYDWLPPRPEEPLPTDCCGSGCSMCVIDLYQSDLQRWRKQCHQLLGGPTSETCELKEWTTFDITEISVDTEDQKVYRFSPLDKRRFPLRPGQHLLLRKERTTFKRPYTPITFPDELGRFDVCIKTYAGGRMSEYVRHWRLGTQVQWRGPFGDFAYSRNMSSRLLLFAGGTGVAPMFQLLSSILEDERDETCCHLLYSAETTNHLISKSTLDDFAQYWNCHIQYFISKDSADRVCSKRRSTDTFHFHRLGAAHVLQLLTSQDASRDTRALVCGSTMYEKHVINHLLDAGLTRAAIATF